MNAHFLIIGGMKSGTTTLYRDLQRHPRIFLPEDKEPEILVSGATDAEMRDAYARLFRPARSDQLCGEASTAYTKMPTFESPAQTALRLFGSDLKLIYMRRDPLDRAISHYQHMHHHRLILEPLDQAIGRHPELVDYGRWEAQLAPWIATFGQENLLIEDLERFSADRQRSVSRIVTFLGLDPSDLPAIDGAVWVNRKDEPRHISNRYLRAIQTAPLYRQWIRPVFSVELRERLRKALLPRVSDEVTADTKTRAMLRAELEKVPAWARSQR